MGDDTNTTDRVTAHRLRELEKRLQDHDRSIVEHDRRLTTLEITVGEKLGALQQSLQTLNDAVIATQTKINDVDRRISAGNDGWLQTIIKAAATVGVAILIYLLTQGGIG